MKKLFYVVLRVIGIMGIFSIGVVNAQEINKDIVLQATSTASNQTLRINKYFANAYTVNWGDGDSETLSSDKTHTYVTSGTYTITLSLTGGADRWTFLYVTKPLVPVAGTTMTGVKITSMPSLAEGFGANATNPENYYFLRFNADGAITSLPEGSFDTSSITSTNNNFFNSFNWNGQLTSLPTGSFDISNITTVGTNFFENFNKEGSLTVLPEGSFDISNITSVKEYFFYAFNSQGSLTSLPTGSFKLSTGLTTVGNYFFILFNYKGALTSLPEGSFDTSNISGSVGSDFFYGFNQYGALESLPEGSFNTSNITAAGNAFFRQFNVYGEIKSLPEGSFNISNLTTVGNMAFRYFNGYGALESLPEGSFNISNITTVGTGLFAYFNRSGAITELPNSFTMNSTGAANTNGYQNAFNSTGYTINRNVSDLVSGVTVPSSDMDTFSDNQPGRCGVHENWLVTTADACHIRYDANGGNGSTTGGYAANVTNVVAGSGIAEPTRVGYIFDGWYTASGNRVDEVAFPEMDGQTLYAHWELSKDIVLQATSTAANQTLKINKYFANAYTVDRGDENLETLSSNKTHTYATAGTYTITLSLTGGADRWTFRSDYYGNPLIPTAGTTMTGVKIVSMPSLAEGFGDSATSAGIRFFQNFNYKGAITLLPEGSFDTSNITTVGDGFFDCFNREGKLIDLPAGSFNISNITSVGMYFLASFNRIGQLTSLPTGSFVFSTGLTVADEYFFSAFNMGGHLTSLPEGSFDTSNITTAGTYFFPNFNSSDGQLTSLPTGSFNIENITTVGDYFFFSFNSYGKLTSLPEGSFDTSNIITVGDYFFDSFNNQGQIINLPDSFKLISDAYNKINGYQNAFNSSYTINKKVSDLVSGLMVPSNDRDTFSDNQPGRCGVHANWLVTKEGACSISYSNGLGWVGTYKYISDATGVEVGSGVILPDNEGYTFSGRYDISGNRVDEVVFPEMDGKTLYASWTPNEYTITFNVDGTLILITGDYGSPIAIPANPTKNGYKFVGWDPEIPATMPAEDMTIEAKWEKLGSSGGGGRSNSVIPNDSETNQGASSGDSQQSEQASADTSEGQNNSEGISTYSTEFQQAYEFAKGKGITTMDTIDKANMNGKLTRIAMAKMLSQYAMNVLGQKPANIVVPNFDDVTDKQNFDYDDGVILAYQLGIMGINMPNNCFRPNDEVTRGEFVTALSRMLYNTSDGEYKSTPKYYINHMKKMKEEGIITKDDPNMKELRGYVMIMLMRSAK